MTKLKLVFPGKGVSASAELFSDRAPRTCAAILAALPFEGELQHAIWSGPETYLLIDPGIRIAAENQTTHPVPGDIGYFTLAGGLQIGWPDDISELAFFYGRGAKPSMPNGPVAVNLFAHIAENLDGFADACARIRREGVERFRVEEA